MAKTHKHQHTIPKVYLASWLEPYTPPGQTAAINVVTKATRTVKRRSPAKSFTENDRYTIRLKDGTRDLSLENTLGRIESEFQGVVRSVRERQRLSVSHRAKLAVFTAAMMGRSKPQADWMRQQMQPLQDIINETEKTNGGTITSTGEELRDVFENHPAVFLSAILESASRILFSMDLSILTTEDPLGFITSDSPAVMFNPNAYKLPPFYRSPGLAMRDIEVTLPLTPRHMAVYTHFPKKGPYLRLNQSQVDELNRRTWYHASDEIVSKTGDIKDIWYETFNGPLPDDAWKGEVADSTFTEHQEMTQRVFLADERFNRK